MNHIVRTYLCSSPTKNKRKKDRKEGKRKGGKEVKWEGGRKEGVFFFIEDPYFDLYHNSLTLAINEHSMFLSLCCLTLI